MPRSFVSYVMEYGEVNNLVINTDGIFMPLRAEKYILVAQQHR